MKKNISIKKRLIDVKTNLNKIKQMDEEQRKSFKQYNALLKATDFNNISKKKNDLETSSNWILVHFVKIHGSYSVPDNVFEYYSPIINQALRITLNPDALFASVQQLSEEYVRGISLDYDWNNLTNLTDYESILDAKLKLESNPDWQLLNNETVDNSVDEIYEFYTGYIYRGITIRLNSQNKTASIEKSLPSRLEELLYPENLLKRCRAKNIQNSLKRYIMNNSNKK